MTAVIVPMQPRLGAVRQKLHRLTVLGLVDAWRQDPEGNVQLRTAGGDEVLLPAEHVWPYLEGLAHGHHVATPDGPPQRRVTFRVSLTEEHAAGRRAL